MGGIAAHRLPFVNDSVRPPYTPLIITRPGSTSLIAMEENKPAAESTATDQTHPAQPTVPKRRPATFNFDMSEIVSIVTSRWYWFVISLVFCLALAIGYLMRTQYTYQSSSRIMLLSAEDATTSNVDLSALGIGRQNANIINETYLFESPLLMEEVVRRLGLNNRYYTKDGLRFTDLYGETPILVIPADTTSRSHYAFHVDLDGKGGFRLHSFSGIEDEDVNIRAKLGQTVRTPFGPFTVTRSPWYSGNKYGSSDIIFSHVPAESLATGFVLVSAFPDFDRATVINLSITDISAKRAADINRMLVQVYADQLKADQSKSAQSTTEFINNRLGILEEDLGAVEGSISSFKANTRIPNVDMASSAYFGQSLSTRSAVLDLNASIAMAQYVRRELMTEGVEATLPVNTGLEAAGIQSQITEYNRMVMERNRLLNSGSENNPVISELTNTLKLLKNNIVRSLDNLITNLNNQLANLNTTESRASSELAANPSREKFLLSVERQQKVKEQLYMFLLQKREESELSQAYIKENIKVLAEAQVPGAPVAPRRLNIILVAIAVGLLAPLVFIFLRESLNTTVRTRRDLGVLGIPFVGEIPYGPGRPPRVRFLRKQKPASVRDVVVAEGSNNVINEAFRAIRTSLEFMAPDVNQQGARVISFTSACSGSGKTFVVMNLAMALALTGKKVLCIDLDMRKASLSKWIGRTDRGISNYMIGQVDAMDVICHKVHDNENIDLLPVGILPPNPVELLSHDELPRLIKKLRGFYDYILIDCPPAEIVADARLVSMHTDMTLYVVRSGMFEKVMFDDLMEYMETGRYHNLAIILNGTDPNSMYRRKRYGYGYGYGYVGK